MATDARFLDFLGEGLADQGDAPEMTEEEIRRYREGVAKREATLAALATPYGSEESPTAGRYQVTKREGGDLFPGTNTTIRRMNPDGSATGVVAGFTEGTPAGTVGTGEFNDLGGIYTPPTDLGQPGYIAPAAKPYSLDETLGDGSTGDIQADAGRRSDAGRRERDNALQGIIDRFDEAKASFDTARQDQSRQAQQQALKQNQEIFNRAASFDRDAAAKRFSDEALANSLAIARSAPGGASRASALMNALQSQPSIMAEAQRQANEEGRQQQNVALQASAQLGQIAGQTRGQDEAQAEALTGIGLDVAKQIANATGLNLELDQRDREFLGEVALQVANLNLDVERLGVDEALRQLELQLAREGLAQEWRIFKQSQKITGKDILGGILGIGGSIIGGVSTGLASR